MLKMIIWIILTVIFAGMGTMCGNFAIQAYKDWRAEKASQITPQEKEDLSPKISVGFNPFVDEVFYPTPHEYPLKEYQILITNQNRKSVPVSNMMIEFFFNNTIVQASCIVNQSGASGVQSAFRTMENQNGKTTYTELPAESPIPDPATSLNVEKQKINEDVVNTNISVFNSREMITEAVYDSKIVVDLTKRPTLIRRPDLMGRYIGKYEYKIKGKQFIGEIKGTIPAAKKELIEARSHYNKGLNFVKLQNLHEAVLEYDKAIDLYPQYVNAYFDRGYAFLMLNENEKAILDSNKALELDPHKIDAYFNKAGALGNLKRFDEAIQLYTIYLEKKPNDAEGHYARGLAYGHKGQNDEAMSDFNKAIELNPNYLRAYLDRGAIYERLGNYDGAISDYRKALELNPKISKEIETRISAVKKNRSLK